MPASRTGSRGASPVGFEAVGSEPIALSEITTLTSLTDSLLRDYDALVARSGTGLRSCKEVHAFLKERSVIEATYGNALVRQARASAGSLERGTCRMGWFAFKSMSESIGRKHLELASHYNADCTALQYLRDRLAGAHRSLVAEGTGAVKDARASLAALHKARARHAKLAKALDAAVLALHGEPGSTALPLPRRPSLDPLGPSTPGSSPVAATPAAAEAAAASARAQQQAAAEQLVRDLEASSAAYSEALRTHQDALRCLRGQLPKLVQDFEKLEGQRIDSFKMALKKLLSAQEGVVVAQRPLLFAATDMVDAIAREEDVGDFMQELTCEALQGAEIQQQIDDQARQLSWLEQQQALLAEPASPEAPRRAAPLGVAPPGQLHEVDRAAKLTKEFVQLSTDGFGPGLALRDAAGQRVVVQRLEQLEPGLRYLTPLEHRLVRAEGDVLLLEDTPVTLPRAAEAVVQPDSEQQLATQLQLATAFAEQALQAAPAPSALEVSFEAEGDGSPAAPLRLGAAEAEACTLTCSAQAFVALVSGTLQPAAAVVRKQLQTSTLPALLQLVESAGWDRERFCAFVAERATAERRAAQRGALDADPAEGGGGGGDGDDDVPSSRGTPDVMRRSRSRASIDEEAVRLAKLEMRRMAEESGDASAGLASGLWTALSSIGGEATKSALLSGARLLRSAARGTAGAPEKLVEPDYDEMEKQGLDDDALLSVLGGDGALTQGFLFLPMAFLGCDWSGLIHVSVQHDGGTHAMTLVVTPQGPTLLHGHAPRVPMLTVVARREVLLDILEGKLDATRAVVTRQVTVSDLSKLILFKSAFRFKRAVWEAFRNAQTAKLAANQAAANQAVPADWQARLEAHPPDAALRAQLKLLADDAELRDAARYAVYAFCGSDWAGDVEFRLSDGGGTKGVVFSITRTAAKLRCLRAGTDEPGAAAATPPPACSVSCARQVLLDVLTGRLEVTAATMSGKMQSDNFSAVMNFKRAFRFEASAFREFSALVREAPADASATPPTVEPAVDDAEPVAEPTPEERAAAAAATASVDPSVLALLGDDVELIDTVAFVTVAFIGSEMTVGLLCRVTDGETPLQVVIGASPEGAVVLAGERMSELTVTCTIDCQREPLVQILRGDLEPLMALTSGQVVVDDLGQLMAWKCAFRFERSEFNAFLGERRRLAAAAGAPAV